ncbi:GNAT family N-acetyltransferase [Patescibacteria group bacterium]|nr:GNAT family N-acetyltransferase [Patescibacteria group bacterium]
MIKYRPHAEKDVSFRVKWLNNPKANQFIGDHPGQKTTLTKQKEWFTAYKKDKTKQFFTICDNNQPIGFMGFSHIDKSNKKADIFIAIGEDDFRGKGVGKQSVKWLVGVGFSKLKLHKISLYVFAKNIPAIRLYESLGFKVEGVLKDDAYFSNKYHDVILMAKIK